MKNIHLIPTEKYSDLVHSTNKYGGYFLSKHYSPMKNMGDSYQNIYITSDKEIKEGDYFIALDGSNDIYKANKVWLAIIKENPNPSQKIILTTDQDLIKDGVQAIDDEFLEWFVKNTSCEEVGVENKKLFDGFLDPEYGSSKWRFEYKIIIPSEEPKHEKDGAYIKEQKELRKKLFNLIRELEEEELKQETVGKEFYEAADKVITVKRQETLEEVLLKKIETNFSIEINTYAMGLADGAKWQAERMYSKEDLISFAHFYFKEEFNSTMQTSKSTDEIFKEWFEQNKNK